MRECRGNAFASVAAPSTPHRKRCLLPALCPTEDEVIEIRRTFTERFEELLGALPSDPPGAEALTARLSEMRNNAIARHDYYERYCNQYLTVGLAMLPFAFTIGGFVLNFLKTGNVAISWAIPAACGILAFAGTGLAVLTLYISGTATDYSYRQIARMRSWYDTHDEMAGTGDADRMRPEHQEADRSKYAENLRTFGEQWLAFMQVPWQPIAEDIERVFSLWVLQAAKRREVRRLARLVHWGVIAGTVLLMLGLVYLALGIGTHMPAVAVTGRAA